MIFGMSPVRISFAGGGTDVPEFYSKYGGNVITSAISQFTYVIIHPRNDNSFQAFSPDFQKHYKPTSFSKLTIEDGTEIASSTIKYLKYKMGINVILFSDVPGGSGLGASSSLTVNLVNLIAYLKNEKWSKQKIAETAFHVGRKILHWPIGKQDEYASAYGGLNFIKFEKNKVSVNPIKLKKSSEKELENNLLLFFVGKTRNSANILSEQINRIKQNNNTTVDSLLYVKNLTLEMHDSLKKSDLTNFGNLLHQGWMAKRKFSSGVTNNAIDKIYSKALDSGAIGGKLTGAGGGGHMLFYCESKKQKSLIKEMTRLGLSQVKFNFYYDTPKITDTSNMKISR